MRPAFALALLAAALGGCPLAISHDSIHVSTLDLQIGVEAVDDGVTAVKIHLDSPLGDVHLMGGDALRLTAGGAAHPLVEASREDGTIRYLATFGDADGVFQVDVVRAADRDAPGLAFTMPPSFTLTAPDVPAAGPIVLTWDPGDLAGYTLALSITGACVAPLGRALAQDTGSYQVDPAELVPTAGGRCPLTVTLERSAAAQFKVLQGLDSGYFSATAVQRRAVTLQWGP
jgi:hypothetical protein